MYDNVPRIRSRLFTLPLFTMVLTLLWIGSTLAGNFTQWTQQELLLKPGVPGQSLAAVDRALARATRDWEATYNTHDPGSLKALPASQRPLFAKQLLTQTAMMDSLLIHLAHRFIDDQMGKYYQSSPKEQQTLRRIRGNPQALIRLLGQWVNDQYSLNDQPLVRSLLARLYGLGFCANRFLDWVDPEQEDPLQLNEDHALGLLGELLETTCKSAGPATAPCNDEFLQLGTLLTGDPSIPLMTVMNHLLNHYYGLAAYLATLYQVVSPMSLADHLQNILVKDGTTAWSTSGKGVMTPLELRKQFLFGLIGHTPVTDKESQAYYQRLLQKTLRLWVFSDTGTDTRFTQVSFDFGFFLALNALANYAVSRAPHTQPLLPPDFLPLLIQESQLASSPRGIILERVTGFIDQALKIGMVLGLFAYEPLPRSYSANDSLLYLSRIKGMSFYRPEKNSALTAFAPVEGYSTLGDSMLLASRIPDTHQELARIANQYVTNLVSSYLQPSHTGHSREPVTTHTKELASHLRQQFVTPLILAQEIAWLSSLSPVLTMGEYKKDDHFTYTSGRELRDGFYCKIRLSPNAPLHWVKVRQPDGTKAVEEQCLQEIQALQNLADREMNPELAPKSQVAQLVLLNSDFPLLISRQDDKGNVQSKVAFPNYKQSLQDIALFADFHSGSSTEEPFITRMARLFQAPADQQVGRELPLPRKGTELESKMLATTKDSAKAKAALELAQLPITGRSTQTSFPISSKSTGWDLPESPPWTQESQKQLFLQACQNMGTGAIKPDDVFYISTLVPNDWNCPWAGMGTLRKSFDTLREGNALILKHDGLRIACKMAPFRRNEVEASMQLCHTNILPLWALQLGEKCLVGSNRHFVYGYIPLCYGDLGRTIGSYEQFCLRTLMERYKAEKGVQLKIIDNLLFMLLEISRGIQYLHTQSDHKGIISHRDIKPGNIFIARDWCRHYCANPIICACFSYPRYVIADFDTCTILDQQGRVLPDRDRYDPAVLVTGRYHLSPVGTQGFKSPEGFMELASNSNQLLPNLIQTDIFSLGCLTLLLTHNEEGIKHQIQMAAHLLSYQAFDVTRAQARDAIIKRLEHSLGRNVKFTPDGLLKSELIHSGITRKGAKIRLRHSLFSPDCHPRILGNQADNAKAQQLLALTGEMLAPEPEKRPTSTALVTKFEGILYGKSNSSMTREAPDPAFEPDDEPFAPRAFVDIAAEPMGSNLEASHVVDPVIAMIQKMLAMKLLAPGSLPLPVISISQLHTMAQQQGLDGETLYWSLLDQLAHAQQVLQDGEDSDPELLQTLNDLLEALDNQTLPLNLLPLLAHELHVPIHLHHQVGPEEYETQTFQPELSFSHDQASLHLLMDGQAVQVHNPLPPGVSHFQLVNEVPVMAPMEEEQEPINLWNLNKIMPALLLVHGMNSIQLR